VALTVVLGVLLAPSVAGAHMGSGNATPSNGGADPMASHPLWSKDYCTSSPNTAAGDFRHACVHHDGCLTGFPRNGRATYWASLSQCNRWFYEDLIATCRELYPSERARLGCVAVAKVYYAGVVAGAGYSPPLQPPEPGRPAPETSTPIAPLPDPGYQPIAPLPTLPVPPTAPPTGTPAPVPTYGETTGGPTNTWTNHTNAGGSQGPTIPTRTTVQIACKLRGFAVANGNTWWYRIASSPWDQRFYASADAFYNNGATSGSLVGTPYVDGNVRDC
jgi:hypothetical protein